MAFDLLAGLAAPVDIGIDNGGACRLWSMPLARPTMSPAGSRVIAPLLIAGVG